ncbi:MAG: 2-C-methyl-D-erythritol 4-phosphate cytidylyltransferase [Thermodesulfobacteriota bacterium]|nr:2-C-methyl-D-erythritol 4-phosphate cytidylyltransferase [Thermodesulfobacteriota bacterium]
MKQQVAAIIPAGGIGSRMGLEIPKQFYELNSIPVLAHTLLAFQQTAIISSVIVVVPLDHLEHTERIVRDFKLDKVVKIVPGGRLRQDSVQAGLLALDTAIDYVAVHDAARPLISPELITACVMEAQKNGAAMAAVPAKDTLKEVNRQGEIRRTIDREKIWQAQTPQVVRVSLLRQAFSAAKKDNFIGTDEASLLEHLGIAVMVVNGSEKNIKITRPDDLLIAEALLMQEKKSFKKEKQIKSNPFPRVGHGYDAHRLVPERHLVLGGVSIPHSMGLLGHSDADVLTHALCDAVLGALGEGDIGQHFPDSDPKFKGISSILLLEQVISLVHRKGFFLVNADVTVIAQQPKLSPYMKEMKGNLAAACRVGPDAINLKATTTEEMGFPGREEGIAAHGVALLAPVGK